MAWRGCIMKWAQTEFVTSKNITSRSSRLNHYNQQRCFRREAKRPETKKSTQETQNASPAEAGAPGPPPPAPPPPRVRRPNLFKPLMFTVGFTGCSFGAAAILQYETLKSRVQSLKDKESENLLQGSQDMAYWHQWWNQLSSLQQELILLMAMVDDFWNSLTEGQKTAAGIIAVNAVVLLCWRIPSLQRSMFQYFTANPAAKSQCLPMALSSFSHVSALHMIGNMYILWTFSSGIVSLLGREQFLAVYMSAGVISTMFSYMCKTATWRLYPSLGASGAVMAVLAAVCVKVPEANLATIFSLPFVVPITAGSFLKALLAIDAGALIIGSRLFDHAAHLGGALFGIWYVAYGHKLMWRKREPLVKLWHDMRSQAAGGSRPGGGAGSGGSRAGGGGPRPQ